MGSSNSKVPKRKKFTFKVVSRESDIKLPLRLLPPADTKRIWKPPVHSADLKSKRLGKVPIHSSPDHRIWKHVEADPKRRPPLPAKRVVVFALDSVAEGFWYRFVSDAFGLPRLDQESGYWTLLLHMALDTLSEALDRDTIPRFYQQLSITGRRQVTALNTWQQVSKLIVEARDSKHTFSKQDQKQVLKLFQQALSNQELLNTMSLADFSLARSKAPSPILTRCFIKDETILFVDMAHVSNHKDTLWIHMTNLVLIFWNVARGFDQFAQHFSAIRNPSKTFTHVVVVLVSKQKVSDDKFGQLAKQIQIWVPRFLTPEFFIVRLDEALAVHSIVDYMARVLAKGEQNKIFS